MKIAVFSDLHGSVKGAEEVKAAVKRECPQKVVICGDVYGCSIENKAYIGELLSLMVPAPYMIQGNNDYSGDEKYSGLPYTDNLMTYHFDRTLFFNHGHSYNAGRIPPLLKEGDALIYGHTHIGFLRKQNGIFVVNVGSVSRPRGGVCNYLVIDDNGFTLKTMDGEALQNLPFKE
ncbi:MAG: YfcE family phosphodiesterase [Corallococcus sp.]|nr:YfcE family phosphodiesterase [Corallococcus sp.]